MSTADLKKIYEDLEAKGYKALETYEKAPTDQHRKALRTAWDKAAEAQKAWCDAAAAEALVGRDDAETVADALGLALPE